MIKNLNGLDLASSSLVHIPIVDQQGFTKILITILQSCTECEAKLASGHFGENDILVLW